MKMSALWQFKDIVRVGREWFNMQWKHTPWISRPHALIMYSVLNWGDITKLLGIILHTVIAQGDEWCSGVRRCVHLLKQGWFIVFFKSEETRHVIIMSKILLCDLKKGGGGGGGGVYVGVLYVHKRLRMSGCHPETWFRWIMLIHTCSASVSRWSLSRLRSRAGPPSAESGSPLKLHLSDPSEETSYIRKHQYNWAENFWFMYTPKRKTQNPIRSHSATAGFLCVSLCVDQMITALVTEAGLETECWCFNGQDQEYLYEANKMRHVLLF